MSSDKNSGHSFFDFPFSGSEFLGRLSPSDRQAFDSLRCRKHFSKDDEIFSIGQMPEFLYVLNRGQVALMHHSSVIDATFTSPNGAEKIFGAVEAFSAYPFDSTLKAMGPCEFDVVDKSRFFDFLLRQPSACLQMTIMISERYQQSVVILDSN
ncbi:MAG TPA: cyclic nucleotide-binding domain-containing protein [Pyrinomonadaceae bacterium]|nr:cyclic nucleotide-binding domain-containing protein [Chloracidobacterium sp.]MBP9935005.1 cyclic nucleotide-binding domain-containing protein [Pyrinomonadaceae bacterium]MBK7801368.1 cyclic nucleotide-binding domain-containing protein [Chloracidobacterium sp.]MBK9436688.1 cyclic nucleotide-binding domain-containing protein [Chloracidobacterium sp.]MBL0241678.1 cyclic nucleotide-binding domain-containing protein [Chloracidobacterium sp.]